MTTVAFPVGYRAIESPGTPSGRIDVWYPASASDVASLASDSPRARHNLALVVLSRGDFGTAVPCSWVGEALARRGFIVAGTGHRPRDCSAAIDAVLEDPVFQHRADPSRVGAVGHSTGGAAVISLAGAVFDPQAMSRYCGSGEARADCSCAAYRPEDLAAGASEEDTSQDERVRAVVAMDPACGPGYDARSLSRVTAPVLIIGSVDNDFLPFAHHAGRYARLIPGASLTPLAHGEGHFVFADECSADHAVNGVPVCRDKSGVSRSAVHERLAEKIASFLDEHLNPESR